MEGGTTREAYAEPTNRRKQEESLRPSNGTVFPGPSEQDQGVCDLRKCERVTGRSGAATTCPRVLL